MAPKRTGRHSFNVILLEAVGEVSWLRVTCSRDSKENRQCFCVNFYSGSPESPAGAHISHLSRTSLKIRDVDVRNSGIENQAFVESHIIQAVRDLEGI